MTEKPEIQAEAKTPELPLKKVASLKAAREARGLSLSDVFNTTRVSRITLEALENDDFDRLPPPVYTRNFIRKYAQAVGIDEKPLLDRYEKHREGLTPSCQQTEVQKPWPEDGRRYRFLFGTLTAVIVAGVLVYAVFLYDQNHNASVRIVESTPQPQGFPAPSPGMSSRTEPTLRSEPLTASPPTPVMTKAAPAPTVSTAAPPATAPPAASPIGKTLHLVIEAQELTWLRITEDRNPASQLLMNPGDRVERRASDAFLLDIGNAGGITLIFQGKSLGSPGKRGQVIHMRLPDQTQEQRSP